MAGELRVPYTTGKTVYAVIARPSTGQFWYPIGTAFEAYNAAHWTAYAVALTETGPGLYLGTFPSGITAPDSYAAHLFSQAGGSPATSDTLIGSGTVQWDGSAEVTLLTLAMRLTATRAGYLDAAISTRLATSGYSAAPDAPTIAAAVWAYVVEGSYTAVNFLRIAASGIAGKVSGANTTTIRVRNVSDTKDIVVATVDSVGDRSAITVDAS